MTDGSPIVASAPRVPAGLLAAAVVAVLVAAAWWWLGRPVPVPPSPLAPGEKMACLSYAPYEGDQTPFDPTLTIPPDQIDRQLGELSKVTSCVRTYSTGQGLAAVPELAAKHGLKVLQGVWLSRNRTDNAKEIATAIELAKAYPDTIRGFVVGNEVLLRRDLPVATLAEAIRTVRQAVKPIPVTYADVWEFWEANAALAPEVDFVTIHMLPYWENQPIPVGQARDHVAKIYRDVQALLPPGKPILIGETGWPSRGRMREGALPSPSDQVKFLTDIVALSKTNGWDYNLIEALDQPWKRLLEGTVGGHWGVLDDQGAKKFTWGEPISDHPGWLWQGALGVVAAAGLVLLGRRTRGADRAKVVVLALVTGLALPWWVEEIPVISLDQWDWLFSGLLLALGIVLAPLAVLALARGGTRPGLAAVLGADPAGGKTDWIGRTIGWGLVLTIAIGLPTLIAMLIDSRYRDFQFSGFAVPAVALLVVPVIGAASRAERIVGLLLAVGAIGVVVNEGLQNWQAILFSLAFLALAAALRPWRGARA
ncbi:glycoside hydrolase family 17 protein [Segnochrobactrum spirostomi]|uniref:Endo-1,3-beta-glucanase btgC n=1 Tax=Segnochrobactrum spirostomi TaxID=2608987 RepID=A0A6A7Y1C1_9HYPH|nr:beta-1,6-glucan synthase [Segnochrobactrum spirostomi]MQT12187.1 beta-1,6-glucan synthase [Segnochrobactrum spirostomi]